MTDHAYNSECSTKQRNVALSLGQLRVQISFKLRSPFATQKRTTVAPVEFRHALAMRD